jgi:hypothetical protein
MPKRKRTTKETVEAIMETATMGRPSSYRAEYADQAAKLCRLGATDAQLADFFDVSVTTIKNWQARHPQFLAALKAGKDEADDRVERSLYHRAIGYDYDSVKVFNANGSPLIVPYRTTALPDVTAAIFWLKNRRPDRWRDVHKYEQIDAHEFDRMSIEELRAFIAEESAALGLLAVPLNGRGNGRKH